MSNLVFFPQSLLDILMPMGKVDLKGEELVVKNGSYRYKVTEAVRVVTEVTTGDDPAKLCGKVKLRAELTEKLGAELLGGSMLIDESAYDVVVGFVGSPSGPAEAQPGAELAALAALQQEIAE